MSDIVERLRGTAEAFELAGAPGHLVLYLRAGADEIARLRAGGCARDQSVTQYCAEAARLAVENERLRNELHLAREWSAKVHAGQAEDAAEIERLRAVLEEIAEAGVFSFGLSFDPDDGDPVALQGEQRFVLLRDVKAIADKARAALAQPAAPGGE